MPPLIGHSSFHRSPPRRIGIERPSPLMYTRAPYRSSSIARYVTETSTRLFLRTITQRLISANTRELSVASFLMLLPRERMAQVAL